MAELPTFNQAKFDAAWKRYDGLAFEAEDAVAYSSFSLLAECIEASIENGKVCVGLPLGLGKQCVDVPDWVPSGSIARACVSIKYKTIFGVKVPIGVELCIYVADQEVACVSYGL